MRSPALRQRCDRPGVRENTAATMTHPNRMQWILICATTVAGILCWPPDRDHGSNLLIKAVHFAVDPAGSLPALPPALPPGLGDDGDAVAAHDALEADYYRHYNSSNL